MTKIAFSCDVRRFACGRTFGRLVCALLLTGASLVIIGCSEHKEEALREMTIGEMSPNDVIVSVNGASLTKCEVSDKLSRVYKVALRQPGGNPNVAAQTARQEQDRIVDRFIERRLIADTAKRQNLMSADALSAQITSNLLSVAQSRKLSLADFEKKDPTTARYFRTMFEEDILIGAYIATNITPVDGITPLVVSNYLAEVDAENAIVAKTNELKKAELVSIRMKALAAPEKWDDLAENVGNADFDPREMEYDEFDDPNTAEKVFRTKVGGITEPIEEADGYRMVKVLAATEPGSTNSFGEVSARGTRTCSQIYVEKEPLFLKWNFAETEKELRRQVAGQLMAQAVDAMKTNGLNRIVYPHGTNLWSRPKTPKAEDRGVDKTTTISKGKETVNKDKENK